MQTVETRSAPSAPAAGTADAQTAQQHPVTTAPPVDLAGLQQRAEAARERVRTRLAALCHARELRRQHGVRTVWELQTELNHLVACIEGRAGTDMADYRDRLLAFATELADELLTPEPQEIGTERRGEYDCFTQGVHGRAS
jgi:hypothetical protein